MKGYIRKIRKLRPEEVCYYNRNVPSNHFQSFILPYSYTIETEEGDLIEIWVGGYYRKIDTKEVELESSIKTERDKLKIGVYLLANNRRIRALKVKLI